MNQLINSLSNVAYTDNGALSNKSSKSAVLDLFGTGAAMRNRSDEDISSLFSKAYKEDPELALKCAFYIRDIRCNGQGERRVFRLILQWLAKNDPKVFLKNIENVPEYGRYDDLLSVIDIITVNREVLEFWKETLLKDLEVLNNQRG